METRKLLEDVITMNASDVFIIAGSPCAIKKDGHIEMYNDIKLSPQDTENIIREIYHIAHKDDIDKLIEIGDADFSFSISNVGRFRVNAYKQRNSLSAVIRVVQFALPDPLALHIPTSLIDLSKAKKGMVLVTGPAGSGKSTTLACMIDQINRNRNTHIITIEDPIEYLHSHQKSIVSQREVYHDTLDYVSALRAALREAPEVILVGEMRDLETIETAITAAETGHLVIATLHTKGAVNTIDRIVDSFPADQQDQIKIQLSLVLDCIVSQQLLQREGGGMIPAVEIMKIVPAIQNMIRDSKNYQIDNVIQTSGELGMVSMDQYILKLYRKGEISEETALLSAINPEQLKRKLSR